VSSTSSNDEFYKPELASGTPNHILEGVIGQGIGMEIKAAR